MKKILFTLLMLCGTSAVWAQDWTKDLVKLNPEVIDSVKQLVSPENSFYDTYMIYYHQPLQHDMPTLGTLPLRAIMSVYRVGDDISTIMNQMHINGYNLDEDIALIDYNIGSSSGELQGRYEGNLLQVEHRYFGESCPDNPWETLGYCEAKEAAADFHALLEAMKKVFKGKWAVTGVSKGGVAAAIQQAYYPDDADCFVSYVAPFMFSEQDKHMVDYMMTNSWTPELREKILHIQKEMLNRPSVFKLCYPREDLSEKELNNNRCALLFRACTLDHEIHKFQKRSIVKGYFAENEAYLKSKGLEDYTDEMLIYMMNKNNFFLGNQGDSFERWSNQNHNSQSASAKEVNLPLPSVFAVEKYQWKDKERETANHYQAKHELGYYDLNFEFFYDTKEEVDSVTAMWRSTAQNMLRFSTGGLYDSVEYDPSLMEFVCQQTANSQKPMLFIYGEDDLWTGARMPEQYINNKNVRLQILPEMNHETACIFACSELALQNELWAFLDDIFRDNASAIQQVNRLSDAKTLHNILGQPVGNKYKGVIIRNGKTVVTK